MEVKTGLVCGSNDVAAAAAGMDDVDRRVTSLWFSVAGTEVSYGVDSCLSFDSVVRSRLFIVISAWLIDVTT